MLALAPWALACGGLAEASPEPGECSTGDCMEGRGEDSGPGGESNGDAATDLLPDQGTLSPLEGRCGYTIPLPVEAPLIDNFGKWATPEERSRMEGDWEYFLLPRSDGEEVLEYELVQEVGNSHLRAHCLDDPWCNGDAPGVGKQRPHHVALRYQFFQGGYYQDLCYDASGFEGFRFNAWDGLGGLGLEVFVETPHETLEESKAFRCGYFELTGVAQTLDVPWSDCFRMTSGTELTPPPDLTALSAIDFVIVSVDAGPLEDAGEETFVEPYDLYLDQVIFY